MDSAALGTTLIGLEAVRRRNALDEPGADSRRARRPATGRAGLAALLRAMARAIEPRSQERAAGA